MRLDFSETLGPPFFLQQHVILYPHYAHWFISYMGMIRCPWASREKISCIKGHFTWDWTTVQPISVSNSRVIYYLWGTLSGVSCPVTGRQTCSHLCSYKTPMCSQANMLAPFIKHLKMTVLTVGSMYDHTITGVIMCRCGGVGAWLDQTSPGQVGR